MELPNILTLVCEENAFPENKRFSAATAAAALQQDHERRAENREQLHILHEDSLTLLEYHCLLNQHQHQQEQHQKHIQHQQQHQHFQQHSSSPSSSSGWKVLRRLTAQQQSQLAQVDFKRNVADEINMAAFESPFANGHTPPLTSASSLIGPSSILGSSLPVEALRKGSLQHGSSSAMAAAAAAAASQNHALTVMTPMLDSSPDLSPSSTLHFSSTSASSMHPHSANSVMQGGRKQSSADYMYKRVESSGRPSEHRQRQGSFFDRLTSTLRVKRSQTTGKRAVDTLQSHSAQVGENGGPAHMSHLQGGSSSMIGLSPFLELPRGSFEDERKSSIAEFTSLTGFKDRDIERIRPVRNVQLFADVEIIDENDYARLMSIYENRFVISNMGHPSVQLKEKNKLFEPYKEQGMTYFALSCTDVKFSQTPFLEPLFFRLALYDINKQAKLSEDFCFHVNKPKELDMLCVSFRQRLKDAQKMDPYDEPTALFKLSEMHTDIFLVITVDRILQSNMDTALKAYKDGTRTDLVRKVAQDIVPFMGDTRSPFLWGATRIYVKANKIELLQGLNITELYPIGKSTTSNPFDPIGLLMKADTIAQLKKQKVECTIKFAINEITNDRLSDMRVKWQQNLLARQMPVQEIHTKGCKYLPEQVAEAIFQVVEDFPLYIPSTPNLAINNSLYIYPENVEFNLDKSTMLRFSFHLIDEPGLPGEICIADPFDQHLRTEFGSTSVFYHCKVPQFIDEIRVDMPFLLPPTTHLIIESFLVSTQRKKDDEPLKRLGYSVLPLFEKHKFISDTIHDLPVYKKLVSHYLKTRELETIKGYRVRVRTKFCGTNFMQDERASNFIHIGNRAFNIYRFYNNEKIDKRLKRTGDFVNEVENFMEEASPQIEILREINPIDMLQHIPVLFNIILRVSSSLYGIMPTEAVKMDPTMDDDLQMFISRLERSLPNVLVSYFRSLLYLFEMMVCVTGERYRRNSILNQYVQYFFHNLPYLDKPFYHYIVDHWVLYLSSCKNIPLTAFSPKYTYDELKPKPSKNEGSSPKDSSSRQLCQMDGIRFAWVFCDMLTKSMALYADDPNGRFNATYVKNDQLFKDKMLQLIKTIVPIFINGYDLYVDNAQMRDVVIRGNSEFAMLFCDLMTFVDSSTIVDWLKEYTNQVALATPNSKILQLEFMEILSYNDCFFPFVKNNYAQAYFLVPYLTDCLLDGLSAQSENVKSSSYRTMRYYFSKLDYDIRLQGNLRQEVINWHFPMIKRILEHQSEFLKTVSHADSQFQTNLPKERIVDFTICFNYLLFNIESSLMEQYIEEKGHSVAKAICELLLLTLIVVRQFNNITVRKALLFITQTMFKRYVIDRFLKVRAVKFLRNEIKPSDNEEEFKCVIDIFDRSAYLLINMALSASVIDTKTICDTFEKQLSPFLSSFGKLFTMYRDTGPTREISTLFSDLAIGGMSTWCSLMGITLLYSLLPSSQKTHPSIAQCLISTSSLFNQLPDSLDEYELPIIIEEIEEGSNTPVDEEDEEDEGFTSDDEVLLDPSENNTISGATLRKLVEHMCSEEISHPPFYQSFLLTYKTFCKPVEVLVEMRRYLVKLLKRVSESQNQEKEKKTAEKSIAKILQCLKFWINTYYSDFDSVFIASLVVFLDSDLAPAMSAIFPENHAENLLHAHVARTLTRKLLDLHLNMVSSHNVAAWPKSIVPQSFTRLQLDCKLSTPSFNFMEWDNMELARQITLIDFESFKPLQFNELFVKNTLQEYRQLAPHVYSMTDRFNKMSAWAVTYILSQPDDYKRQAVLKKLIDLCDKLYELRNFNTLYTFAGGAFGDSSVYRIKTWDAVPDAKEKRNMYRDMLKHPYGTIRQISDQAPPPSIPFVGMFLNEIEFNESNTKFVEKRKKGRKRLQLINFKRCMLNVKSIQRMREKQQKFYEFHKIPYLYQVLQKDLFVNLMTKDEAWQRSLELFPSARGVAL